MSRRVVVRPAASRHRRLITALSAICLGAAALPATASALVVGHVSGLALAHDRALATYRSPALAVRSQYWMLVVMVGFTSLGLWLLSAVNT